MNVINDCELVTHSAGARRTQVDVPSLAVAVTDAVLLAALMTLTLTQLLDSFFCRLELIRHTKRSNIVTWLHEYIHTGRK